MVRAVRRFLKKSELYLFACYAVVTTLVTYPAITMSPRVHALPGDPTGTLYLLWWFRYSFFAGLPVSNVGLVAAPFGWPLNIFATDVLTNNSLRALSIITNEAAAYNIFLMLSFFLSAVAMYYLVRYLTGSRPAAFFSGLAYAFCPYMLFHGEAHLGLVAAFWIPFFFLLLVKAWRERRTAYIIASGLSFIVLTLFNYQYGLLSGLFAVAFLCLLALMERPWSRRELDWEPLLKAVTVAFAIGAALFVLFILFSTTSRAAIRVDDATSVVGLSARPLDYLVPKPGGSGGILGRLLGSGLDFAHQGAAGGENSVFLGYIPLALALYALVLAVRGRRWAAMGTSTDLPEGSRTMIAALTACAGLALVLSGPPVAHLFGVTFNTPSYLLKWLFPNFRAYARFGLVVMFCVAVLAGFGLAALVRRWRLTGARALAIAALCVLVLLEFANVPPFHSLDTRATTDYYRWLRDRPADVTVAIYPMTAGHTLPTYEYLFWQRVHQKKMVNGAGVETPEAERFRETVMDLTHPATPGILSYLGVDYVMVMPGGYLEGDGKEWVRPVRIDSSRIPAGLRIAKRFDGCEVYEVDCPPAGFIPLFGLDTKPEVDRKGNVWHRGGGEVEADIDSRAASMRKCDIDLVISGDRPGRWFQVSVNGQAVERVLIGKTPGSVHVEEAMLAPGRNVILVERADEPVGEADWFLVSNILITPI